MIGKITNLSKLTINELEALENCIFLLPSKEPCCYCIFTNKRISYFIVMLHDDYDYEYNYDYGRMGDFAIRQIGIVYGQPGVFDDCLIGNQVDYRLANLKYDSSIDVQNGTQLKDCPKDIQEQIATAYKAYQLTQIIET